MPVCSHISALNETDFYLTSRKDIYERNRDKK